MAFEREPFKVLKGSIRPFEGLITSFEGFMRPLRAL